MARIGLICLVFLLSALAPARAGAVEAIFQAFDATPLSPSEKRLLQTALAVMGDYGGPLDGDWGGASQAALEAYAAREFGGPPLNAHAAALVLGFLDEVEASGWDFRYLPDLGVSLALPLARLGPAVAEEGGARQWTDDGRLTLLTQRFDTAAAQSWHAAAVKASARPETLVTERAPARMITSGVLRDGRDFYTRSDRLGAPNQEAAGGDRTGETWATVFLAAEPDQHGTLNLAARSIRPGRPPAWDLPGDGRLAALVRDAEQFLAGGEDGTARAVPWVAATPEEAPAATAAGAMAGLQPDLPSTAGFGDGSTGTGFYLAAQTLVTAQHVVAGCARITLADDRPLELLAEDADLDVAVLRAPAPAPRWLTLADGDLRLGQQVHAAGFPYYAIAGTSLNLTSGNVSALAGVDDDRRFFTFSAPVQPGNSGGPLIDSRGGVRGLVVARLSEDYIVETTGSLPQNVNYALGAGELARFLRENRVDAGRGGLGGYDMADGAPAAFAEAVVPIVCR